MTTHTSYRRLLVTVGVAGSLLVAGLTIRTAASWAASQAPLTVAPVSVASVQQALDQERDRSTQLEAQLRTLEASTAQLVAALDAAQAQVGADEATAAELRASLAAAQERLAKLQASIKAASGGGTSRTSTTTRSTSTSGGEYEDGHDDD